MTFETDDRFCQLPDGRRLAYREYGARDGFPVVALHGTPGSRLKYAAAGGAAMSRGLRLISPDRWGYGLSEAPRSKSLRGYADDIAVLADQLGLDTFAVVGSSGGGPFAIVVAAQLRQRIAALALVGPVAPGAGLLTDTAIDPFHRFSFGIVPRIPGVIWLSFWFFRVLLKLSPERAIQVAASRARACDRAVLSDKNVWMDLAETFSNGLEQGLTGAVIDMSLFRRDWSIDMGGISARSRLWLGEDDRNIPLAPARRLAHSIKGLEVTELSDAGHYWISVHYDEVLDWLRAQVFSMPYCSNGASNDRKGASAHSSAQPRVFADVS